MATFLDDSHMKLSEVVQLQREQLVLKEMEKKSKLMSILPWYPTSDGQLHKGTKVTMLPEGAFGAYNRGIATSASSTTEYEETVKFFELKSDIDVRFFKGMSTEQAMTVRANKDRIYSMGYLQSLEKQVVTCDGKDPMSVKGVVARRAKLGKYCISLDAGTASTFGSILFIRPGEDGLNLRYPSGAGAGFTMDDMGIVQCTDKDGKTFNAYETVYTTFYTLDLPDESALIRACNVPTDESLSEANVDLLVDIVNELPNQGTGYIALAPKEIISAIWKYLKNKDNIVFSQRQIEGMGAPAHLFNVPLFQEEYMSGDEGKLS